MFPIDAFRSTVMKVVAIFQKHDIPFHLTGGVTSTAYGEPRMTQDIDIVIGNEAVSKCLDAFLESLDRSDFMRNAKAIRESVKSKTMFQLLDSVESLKLDVYPRELIEGELSRSEEVEVFKGELLPVVARTDAAVSKLIWINKGSHKSRRDFRKLWDGCNDQHRQTIETVANSLDLSVLLQEVISEPDEIE